MAFRRLLSLLGEDSSDGFYSVCGPSIVRASGSAADTGRVKTAAGVRFNGTRENDASMTRFVTGQARRQTTLCSERPEDFIAEDNPRRVIDVYVEELHLQNLGFPRVDPRVCGGAPFQLAEM